MCGSCGGGVGWQRWWRDQIRRGILEETERERERERRDGDMGRKDMVAMTCVNEGCGNIGVKVYNRDLCRVCGQSLIPYDDVEWEWEEVEEVVDEAGRVIDMVSGEVDEGMNRETFDDMGNMIYGGQMRMGFDHEPQSPHSWVPSGPTYQAPAPGAPMVGDTFTCPADITGCPIARKPVVEIPLELFNQWIYLAKAVNTEWMAYLKGEEMEPNRYRIFPDGMIFPEQVATPTHVAAKDGPIPDGVIAAVHSHVGMQVFFSGEDRLHANHVVEIVVNRDGAILTDVRQQLRCGEWHRGEGKVVLVGTNQQEGLLRELQGRLSTRRDWETQGRGNPGRPLGQGQGQGPANGQGWVPVKSLSGGR